MSPPVGLCEPVAAPNRFGYTGRGPPLDNQTGGNYGQQAAHSPYLRQGEPHAGSAVPVKSSPKITGVPTTPKKRDLVPKPIPKQPCPSPPSVLKDKKSTVHFTKGRFLGEGGFARCYEVWNTAGVRYAAKVVSKTTLKSDKSKQKLFTEIKIHQNLRHPNIVRFHHVFEDSDNVYMILELCENQTLVDMLKKRRRLTEPEAQFYLAQLIDALRYMHSKRVIHRDLKLGNLFLASDMALKVGDLGLATVLKQDGERKKTICGTPNYIAPEILFDQKHGHSFEVDMWSLGVIMYTLLIGRPPYQTKDLKAIYRNIRENKYEFPASVSISPAAKDLISSLLTTRPDLRPTTAEARNHTWFNASTMPKSMPVSALQSVPLPSFASPKLSTKSSYFTPSKPQQLAQKDLNVVTQRTPLAAIKRTADLNVQSPARQAVFYPAKHQSPMQQDIVVKTPLGFKNSETPISRPAKSTLVTKTPGNGSVKLFGSEHKKLQLSPPMNTVGRKSMLEVMLSNLSLGLGALKEGSIASASRVLRVDSYAAPTVFVSKWIDYSNKYGLGYQLTNGCVGVHYNDSTHVVLSANDVNFEYLHYARGTDRTIMNRTGHTLNTYPKELEKKVTLLKHFKGYMQENLFKAPQYSQLEIQTNNMDFLVKYMRTKHAIMFRLTNRLVQINFFDHTKLILSQESKVVTYINREREMHTYTLEDVLIAQRTDIISRLKYSRDILDSLIHGRKDTA